jgi:hypothetical protein
MGYQILLISKSECALHMAAVSAARLPSDGASWIRTVAGEIP